MDEEELQGGNISVVVRVGETVRREQKTSSEAVHELLIYLESVGFDAAPRFLGIDEQSREILSFIEGTVGCAPYPLPTYMWSEESLIASAKLLRSYHDAVAPYIPKQDAEWIYSTGRPSRGQLVCHNDVAPYNTVFANELPVAFIDWDLAGPADPLADLAHAAWHFVPIGPERSAEAAGVPDPNGWRGRFRAFCDGYGLKDRRRLVPTMIEGRRASIEGILRHAAEGDARFERLVQEGHVEAHRENLEWFENRLAEFADELL